ncbi:hypothetical protein [Polynucleobacter necessarius]|uniref:hypothetical protein n=1 Tax=Polynucleobacter necessarius TaxID=576610 RepID=UPI000E0946E9|nr:hypothetical protein [Polynucleobacter necessarius]
MSEQTIKQNHEDELVAKQSTTSLLSSLRLPDTYSVSGGTALPLKAIYGKLNKHRFCRIHPGGGYKFRCLVVDDKDRGETYLATPNMISHLDNLAVPKTIRLAVDSTGTPKLIGEPDIDPSSRANLWHSSLKYGIERGETTWVRIQANMSAGQYEIIESANDLGEPRWPNQSMEELINDAFSGRIIDSSDHPFIRQIQGRV